jgi:AcrR family transcriptional regulator
MIRNERLNEDLRVKRTHKLILEAMIELTTQKGFSNLTVRDISKYAGINRATFYRHYQDKFDLLNQYVQAVYELPDALIEAGPRITSEGIDKQFASAMIKLFEHVHTNSRFFRVMLGKNGDPAFSEKIRQFIQKRIRHSMPKGLLDKETSVDLYLSYISSGSLGALTWWLEHEMQYSAEEMVAILFRLVAAALHSMFEQTKPLGQLKDKKSLEVIEISTNLKKKRKIGKKLADPKK